MGIGKRDKYLAHCLLIINENCLMKKLLLFVLLLPLWGYAQQHGERLSFSKTIELKGTAPKQEYKTVFAYAMKNANAFYKTNKEAKEHGLMLKRSNLKGYDKKVLLGFCKGDREKYIIETCGLCVYGSDAGCIKVLAVTYDVTVYCMRDKAEIKATNFRYYHFNDSRQAEAKSIISGQKSIADSGTYEELINDEVCLEEQKAISDFVTAAAMETIDHIAERLSVNSNEVNW